MTSQSPKLERGRLLKSWLALCVIATILWAVVLIPIMSALHHGQGFALDNNFPAFEDLNIYRSRFDFFHTAQFFQPHVLPLHGPYLPAAFAYPPMAAVLYRIFYLFPDAVPPYMALMTLWCLTLFALAWKELHRADWKQSQALLVFASGALFLFPVVFLAQRSNLELLVWIWITSALILYRRGHIKTSAILIGLAASVKLYPLILLGIFLRRRTEFSAVLLGITTAIVVTLLAIAYTGPDFMTALRGFLNGLLLFTSAHAETSRLIEAPLDHSLFSPIKLVFLYCNRDAPSQVRLAYYGIAALATLVLFFWRVRFLPDLNRIVFLTLAMMTLPPVSYEYTVSHLYLPAAILFLFVLRGVGKHATAATISFLCLATVMLPIFLLEGGHFLFAGQIQLIALLIAGGLAVAYPWAPKREPANPRLPNTSTT